MGIYETFDWFKKKIKNICCRVSVLEGGTVNKFIVSEYADNAAAILGGLTIGRIYRTGDMLKIVH